MAKQPDGAGTIRRRERNGRIWWEAQISAGYDANGNRKRRTIVGDTQREVAAKMRKLATEINSGEYVEPSQMTIRQWADTWIDTYCTDKRTGTIRGYKSMLKNDILPALGKNKLGELRPPRIQKLYNTLLQDHAVKTVRNIHGVLTKMLSVACDVGFLRTNPADKVSVPKLEKKPVYPLTDAQLGDYLRAAADDDYWAILQLYPLTGLREMEAIGLTWDCINFDAGTITVKQQLVKRKLSEGGYTLAPTKSNNIRVLQPARTVMDILRRRQEEQLEERQRTGDAWRGWRNPKEQSRAFVFTTAAGDHLTNTSVYYHCKRILNAIGAGDHTLHDLRHTFATISLQNGDDVKTVQSNLGHATASFTLDVYGHVSDRMKQDSADRMEAYLSGLK